MDQPKSADQPVNPVSAYLRSRGIEQAVIIDDAYDPASWGVLPEDVGVFWDRIVRDDALREELESVAPGAGGAEDITEDVLEILWERRGSLEHLAPLCDEHLFATKLSKLKDVLALRDNLLSLGLQVLEQGSDEDDPPLSSRLVFIDYFLGMRDDKASVEAAKSRVRGIYDSVQAPEDKPFIILMSSKQEGEDDQDNFREAVKLVRGLFDYVPKVRLRDRDSLSFYLTTWAVGFPAGHTVQRFAEALEEAIDPKLPESATSQFMRMIRKLGFEDYGNIQWFSLSPDGHPLGDYMLWLYKSLLAHLLHGHPRVLEEQKRLDAISFKDFIPWQQGPSLDLADVYRCALTEPGVGPVGSHPLAAAESTEPYLLLGDLLFKEGTAELLMVLNADCDLAYSPGSDRRFPKDLSVLLLHGKLQAFEDHPEQLQSKTELFKHDGRVYRILWNYRNVTSLKYGVVWPWFKQHLYERRARLSLPYALDVQRGFSTSLTRIGMPVKPPLRDADVEVYFEGEGKRWDELIPVVTGGARLIARKLEKQEVDEHLYVLKRDCTSAIINGLGKAVSACTAQIEVLTSKLQTLEGRSDLNAQERREQSIASGKLEGLKNKLDRLGLLGRTFDDWRPLVCSPQSLPAAGTIGNAGSASIRICRDVTIEGKFPSGPAIVIHLRTTSDEVQAEPPTTANEA